MQILEPRKKKPLINITSLIDVLFLLLIFFMVSSTFKLQPGMKLELPESKSFENTEIKELVLQIQKNDTGREQFFLNSKPVSFDSLSIRLGALIPKVKDQALTLKADRDVSHGIVVKAMDVVKQCGVKKLVIATRIKSN